MRKGYFSDEEKEFIAQNAYKYTRKELAQMLNRKHTSISQYLGRNQIECVNQYQYHDNPYDLTMQGLVVLGTMGQGLSNKEIIEGLFISVSTLRTHIVNIYRKLDIECNINSGSEMRVKDIKFKPLKECSKVWFGITRICSLEREGIDFGTFEIHSEITGKEKRFVDKYKDAAFLYYQVLPIIEPYHKDEDEHCNCLICR